MSVGILFEMLVLGINKMVPYLSPEILNGCSLFLIHKTNIFVKLMPSVDSNPQSQQASGRRPTP